MTEWRLFPENTVPEFTTREFFAGHPRIAHEHQAGFEDRIELAVAAVLNALPQLQRRDIVDLGCDDGELLERLRYKLPVATALRGYTLGEQSVATARERGLAVEQLDFLREPMHGGELTVMTEVLEHLLDPHSFLKYITSQWLIVSSPSAETDEWHYEHHAWAWDLSGYRKLVDDAGWSVVDQRECVTDAAFHCGQSRPQRFQVITARR